MWDDQDDDSAEGENYAALDCDCPCHEPNAEADEVGLACCDGWCDACDRAA